MLVKQRQAARKRRKEARLTRSRERAGCEAASATAPLEIRSANKTKTGIWISGLDFGLRGRRRARG